MISTYTGANLGAVVLQSTSKFGGARYVFVKLQGVKDQIFPPIGGKLANPFKGAAKIYAGDLMEYRTDENGENPTLYILKSYKVYEAASGTEVKIASAYAHIPFVGDVLMKAPDTLDGTGTAVTVTAVSKSDDYYTVTLSAALGELAVDDILVEAAAAGDAQAMLVTNPNCFAPCDYDCFYTPAASESDFYGARYYITPILHGTAYINRMSPVPACVKALNKSNINGWFTL